MRGNRYSVDYQIEKYGLTEEEAIDKINKIKNVNVYSIDWQMNKFRITEEEAIDKISKIKNKSETSRLNMTEFEFNSMIPSKKEHWIKKGFSEEVSIIKANDNIRRATKNCNDFSLKIKGDANYNHIRTTNIEYYLKKGYNLEDSKKMLKERQTTFSLEICIEKYGFEEGHKKWRERQEKWLKSLVGKIDNCKKDSISIDFFMKKNNNNYELALVDYKKRIESRLESKFGKASKESMKIFKHLVKLCDEFDLVYYCGVENKREYYIMSDDNKVYAYDFTIPSIKLIFEYHGCFWHQRTEGDNLNELGYNLNESYNKDIIKKELAVKKGFSLYELYSDDGFDFNLNKMLSIFNNIMNE